MSRILARQLYLNVPTHINQAARLSIEKMQMNSAEFICIQICERKFLSVAVRKFFLSQLLLLADLFLNFIGQLFSRR